MISGRLKFGSWASHGLDLNVTNTDIKMDIGAYQESGEWEILGKLCMILAYSVDCGLVCMYFTQLIVLLF